MFWLMIPLLILQSSFHTFGIKFFNVLLDHPASRKFRPRAFHGFLHQTYPFVGNAVVRHAVIQRYDFLLRSSSPERRSGKWGNRGWAAFIFFMICFSSRLLVSFNGSGCKVKAGYCCLVIMDRFEVTGQALLNHNFRIQKISDGEQSVFIPVSYDTQGFF